MDYPLLDELAAFVCETSYDMLPEDVAEESTRIILDSIGCAFAGTTHKRGQIGIAMGRMQGGKDATILGTGERVSIFGAAMANGELINALDFDAVLPPGHIAPYVIGPALAVAEMLKSSGRDLILANAIGHEVTNRIGKAMDYHRDVKDGKVNPPAVWGFASSVFGATVAVAKLKGLTPEQVKNAISLAALTSPVNSSSAWREHKLPTTLKYTFCGSVTHCALTAVLMAEMGHRGDDEVFDPEFGYPRFIGTKRWEPALTVRDLGKVWSLPKESAFKHYPHCRILATPQDALRDIIEANDIKVEEIEGIKAWVEGFTVTPLWLNRTITDVTDAQFSIAHGLAMCAHGYTPGPDWQDPEKVHSPSVMALMDKVEHVVHPDYVKSLMSDPHSRPTRVEVRARGQVFSDDRSHPRGSSRKDSPGYFSTPQLVDKFLVNASFVLPDQQALTLVERLKALAEVDDVNKVTALAAPKASVRMPAA